MSLKQSITGALLISLCFGALGGCDRSEPKPAAPSASTPGTVPGTAPGTIPGTIPQTGGGTSVPPTSTPPPQGAPIDSAPAKSPATPVTPVTSTTGALNLAEIAAAEKNNQAVDALKTAVAADSKPKTAEELKAATPGSDAPPGSAEHQTYQQLLAMRNAKMAAPRAVPGYESVAFSTLTDFGYMPKAPTRAATPEERKIESTVALDADDQIPANIKALAGKKVAIQGFMIPVDFQDGGTNDFLLVQVVPDCYFCQQPQPNEWIEVKTVDGKRLPYSGDESFIVTGTLEIAAKYKGGYFLSLFRMTADGIQKP